jgi:hypothetical protein
MSIRLRLGLGPLRADDPATPDRNSHRRSRSTPVGRAPVFHGTARFMDGSTYTCQHAHQTQQAAAECAAEYKRDLAAGLAVPAPSRRVRVRA